VRNVFSYLTLKVIAKLLCQWREVCRNCSYTVTGDSKHECFKSSCNYCNTQPSGHFCYIAPSKSSKLTDRFMYVALIWSAHRTSGSMMVPFNIFRTSCSREMCSKCEEVDDLNVDSKQCGKRTRVFWVEDPVGKFIISGSLNHSRTICYFT